MRPLVRATWQIEFADQSDKGEPRMDHDFDLLDVLGLRLVHMAEVSRVVIVRPEHLVLAPLGLSRGEVAVRVGRLVAQA